MGFLTWICCTVGWAKRVVLLQFRSCLLARECLFIPRSVGWHAFGVPPLWPRCPCRCLRGPPFSRVIRKFPVHLLRRRVLASWQISHFLAERLHLTATIFDSILSLSLSVYLPSSYSYTYKRTSIFIYTGTYILSPYLLLLLLIIY